MAGGLGVATGLAGSGVTTGLLGLAPPKRLKVGDFLAGAAGFSAGFGYFQIYY